MHIPTKLYVTGIPTNGLHKVTHANLLTMPAIVRILWDLSTVYWCAKYVCRGRGTELHVPHAHTVQSACVSDANTDVAILLPLRHQV